MYKCLCVCMHVSECATDRHLHLKQVGTSAGNRVTARHGIVVATRPLVKRRNLFFLKGKNN